MIVSYSFKLALLSAVACSLTARGAVQSPLDSTCLATPLLSISACTLHDEPTGFRPYMPVEAGRLWEVRMTANKGRGLFAVVDISRGTRLLTEDPLVTVTPPPMVPGRGFKLSDMLESVEEAYNGLTLDGQEEYLSCHEVRFAGEGEDEDDEISSGRLLRILRSNAYNTQDGRVGLYPMVALINHDCRPNVLNTDLKGDTYDADAGRQRVIVATRDIQAGEEIVTTYIPLLLDTATRRARLTQYGFTCGCASCQSAEDDDERIRMKQILEDASAAVEYGTRSRAKDHVALAIELAEYIRDNGFADYGAQTSQMAAELSYTVGDLATAATWAAGHVEVVQLANAEGAESEELRNARKLLKKVNKKIAKQAKVKRREK